MGLSLASESVESRLRPPRRFLNAWERKGGRVGLGLGELRDRVCGLYVVMLG